MRFAREAVRRAAIAAGLHETRLARKLARSGNRLVLLLHRVLPAEAEGDLSPPGMVVGGENFLRLLDWLGGRFDFPSPSAFLERFPEPLPRPAVLLTFDDGWLDTVRVAVPAMRERKRGGVVFVAAAHATGGRLFWPERLRAFRERLDRRRFREIAGTVDSGGGGSWEKLLDAFKRMEDAAREEVLRRLAEESGGEPDGRRVAVWEEIALLPSQGIEIGSHGLSHRLLTLLPEAEAFHELEVSRREILERTGSPSRLIAYPNGDRNETVKELARRTGYQFAFSIRGTPRDRYDIPRVNLHDGKMTDPAGSWSEGRLIWALGS